LGNDGGREGDARKRGATSMKREGGREKPTVVLRGFGIQSET